MRRLKSVLDPYIMMLLASVALATLLPPRGIWQGIVGGVADAGIVLLFFLHGAKLPREAIVAGARNWRLHLLVFAVTFVIFPLLGLGLARLPGLSPPIATGMLFLTLVPSTVQSSIAFTAMARGNVAAAVCSASLSNLAGIFVTPLLVALAISGGEAALSLSSIETIAVQLLLPFLVGQLSRPALGSAIARHPALTTAVDRGSILLVVYAAFGAAVVAGLWHAVPAAQIVLVGALAMLLLAVVLAGTWLIGGALHLPRADAIVLLFCGSKKSLASGVPMAGVLFPPALVGPIILPLMLFHQIQLIACAVIARRLAADDAQDPAVDTIRDELARSPTKLRDRPGT